MSKPVYWWCIKTPYGFMLDTIAETKEGAIKMFFHPFPQEPLDPSYSVVRIRVVEEVPEKGKGE